MTRKVTTRRGMLALLPVGAVAAAAPIMRAAKKAQSPTAAISLPNFIGTLTVTGFSVVNGVLTATSQLVGDVLDASGNVIGTVNTMISTPLAVAATCEILTLTLGPLDLNLLGLAVHLNQVVLNITAVSGAGNLLGNLLCAVTSLLDAGGPLGTLLQQLTTLLNQVLSAL